jgi:nucleotide-binding universal stress UspA family protein
VETIKDRNILIAVDESENSKRALLYVADFLGGFPGFKAIILSVIPVPDEGFFESAEARHAWIESEKEKISDILKRYRQILIQSGFPEEKVRTELVVDEKTSVSSVILKKQKELDSCTVVVGRRGISKSEEFLFGSVSNRVVHMGYKCSVWVVE